MAPSTPRPRIRLMFLMGLASLPAPRLVPVLTLYVEAAGGGDQGWHGRVVVVGGDRIVVGCNVVIVYFVAVCAVDAKSDDFGDSA